MPETFLTSVSHSNFTQSPDLTPLQAKMDGFVSSFVERTVDGYALAGIVSGGIANSGVKGSLLQLARPFVRVAPAFSSVAKGGAISFGLITEGTVFHGIPQGLKVLTGGDLSLLHLDGAMGLKEGALHSITGLVGLKVAGVATVSLHPIVQNFAQASAMVGANHAAAFLGIGDKPRESIVHQLGEAEGMVLHLWAGMRVFHQLAPGLVQRERIADLRIESRSGFSHPSFKSEEGLFSFNSRGTNISGKGWFSKKLNFQNIVEMSSYAEPSKRADPVFEPLKKLFGRILPTPPTLAEENSDKERIAKFRALHSLELSLEKQQELRANPENDPHRRHQIEAALLAVETPQSIALRQRIEDSPTLHRWLTLTHEVRTVPIVEKDEATYKVALWRRDPRIEWDLPLPLEDFQDLGKQVLVVTPPNGKITEGLTLELHQHHATKELSLFCSSLADTHKFDTISPILEEEAKSIAHQLGIPSERVYFSSSSSLAGSKPWAGPYFSIAAPAEIEEAISSFQRDHFHPYQELLLYPEGTYEALRPLEKGQVITNPWFGDKFPEDLASRFLVEIEPKPKTEWVQNYLWGFSPSTGRSVDFFLGEEGMVTPEATRWYHLNAVGVGKTYLARSGAEKRDGKLPLDGAIKRFYLTNLMHSVAGPFGFRTSLGIAVVNREIVRPDHERRPGVSQIEATIYELRRQQLRFNDIERELDREKLLEFAKKKIARELGVNSLTNEEYVQWLAKTLGEQFAIMTFFNFDHGLFEGTPQLHAGNVSLAGEIFDFDVARFSGTAFKRYMGNNYGVRANYVDFQHIQTLQHEWEKDPTQADAWLSILLRLAPKVNFTSILIDAYAEKLDALTTHGISSRKKIDEFNVKIWNPFIRNLSRRMHFR
jgi:hypothetical protein